MKLDKSKKYEFCGEVCEWRESDEDWASDVWYWAEEDFQLFADHGHVTEIREPLVFEGEVEFVDNACTYYWGFTNSASLPHDDRKGKTFKVTWTEVVK